MRRQHLALAISVAGSDGMIGIANFWRSTLQSKCEFAVEITAITRPRNVILCAGALVLAVPFSTSLAAVTISSQPTQNMNCSNGVCAPTAADAVLNATDLENLLGSGNLEVTTTGSGVQASDLELIAPLSWSTGNTLSLDAYHSIAIESQISVEGQAGLSLTTNDGGVGGQLSFLNGGDVTFGNLSSQLVINGKTYLLVNDIASLAAGIAANPAGSFALANLYDASGDGTYNQSPIVTTFNGSFDGLGNTISNLTIQNSASAKVGFFATVARGSVAHIAVLNETVASSVRAKYMGGLIGYAEKSVIDEASVAGSVSATTIGSVGGLVGRTDADQITRSSAADNISATKTEVAGGLVGMSVGNDVISRSYATGNVSSPHFLAGGLVGVMCGKIDQSFATGDVSVLKSAEVGGLVGGTCGTTIISNSYATGSTSATGKGNVPGDAGGLVGFNSGAIAKSYSIGAVSKGPEYEGGLIGYDASAAGSLKKNYWDTTTSGITNLSQGAGNVANDPGITGKTTEQLQSGLPKGFSPKIWGEDFNINNGLPYLLVNPPPQ